MPRHSRESSGCGCHSHVGLLATRIYGVRFLFTSNASDVRILGCTGRYISSGRYLQQELQYYSLQWARVYGQTKRCTSQTEALGGDREGGVQKDLLNRFQDVALVSASPPATRHFYILSRGPVC